MIKFSLFDLFVVVTTTAVCLGCCNAVSYVMSLAFDEQQLTAHKLPLLLYIVSISLYFTILLPQLWYKQNEIKVISGIYLCGTICWALLLSICFIPLISK